MHDAYQFSDVLQRIAVLIQSDSFSKDYGTNEKYTSIEVHTIGYIADNPGCIASDIAYSWGKTTSAVSQILKKLKQANLIFIQKEDNNQKKQCLYLTDKGKELDSKHRQYDKEMQALLFNHLKTKFTEEQINTTIDLLETHLEFYRNSKDKKNQ